MSTTPKISETDHVLFVDTATIESARRVLQRGLRPATNSWDMQSLRELTYYLLQKTLHVLPAIGNSKALVEGYFQLVNLIPEFEAYSFSYKQQAEQETSSWIKQNMRSLATSWQDARLDCQFSCWRDLHKEFAFIDHARRHGSLFEREFVPYIASVLGFTQKDILDLYSHSRKLSTVATWQKRPVEDIVEVIANAWMLAGMLRHIFHQYLALKERHPLLSHQFRNTLALKRMQWVDTDKNRSAFYLSNLLVESLFDLSPSSNKAEFWLMKVQEVRGGLQSNRIALPKATDDADAVKHATRAAADVNLAVSSLGYQRAFETLQVRDLCALSDIWDVREIVAHLVGVNDPNLLVRIVRSFSVIANYCRHRSHGRPSYNIKGEYDAQDLLFVAIRSVFEDARREEWTSKHAGRSKRIDIVVPSVNSVIEVKYVRDARHAATVDDELKIDIESYHNHPHCQNLIALVYDPQGFILDDTPITRDLSGRRSKGGRDFDVTVCVGH